MNKGITELTAGVAARLSGKQADLFGKLLELMLSLIPDMEEFAKLEKVIKDQNVFINIAVKAAQAVGNCPGSGPYILRSKSAALAALKEAAAGKNSIMPDSVLAVLSEREKQRRKWGAEHDARHKPGTLAWAAMYYACPDVNNQLPEALFEHTEWDKKHAKRTKDVRKNLIIAAALLLAEIDSIDAASLDEREQHRNAEDKQEIPFLRNLRRGGPPVFGFMTMDDAATAAASFVEGLRNSRKSEMFAEMYGKPATTQFDPNDASHVSLLTPNTDDLRASLAKYCSQDASGYCAAIDAATQKRKSSNKVGCPNTLGNGDCAYNIMLPYYVRTCGDTPTAPAPKTVGIDKCLLREVLDLWEQGIKTSSVCCGHGDIAKRHISVMAEYAGKMRELGYRPQRLLPGATETDFFPKSQPVYCHDIDKGFNWWSEQTLNTEAAATAQEQPSPSGAHAGHCCILHGCKYGDIQCPVLNGSAEQEGPCEYCCEDAEQWGTTPAEILKKGQERLNSSEYRTLYAVNSGTLKDINKRLERWDARIGLVNGGWEVLVENPSGCWMRGTENDLIMFFNAESATPRIIRKS